MLVSRDIDVNDAAGVDVGWEEDGRELYLTDMLVRVRVRRHSYGRVDAKTTY